MINKDNFKQVLELLGFTSQSSTEQIYAKNINDELLQVDFKNQKLIYPKTLIIHDKTTCNFSKPENFVVFECVCRLLQKGYKAEFIELEPKWNLGRETKGGKADILIRDRKNKPYFIIECKTAQDSQGKKSELSKEWERMQNDGGQLFSYFQQERNLQFLCLYASDLEDNELSYKNYIIQVKDNEDFLKQSKKQGYKDAKSNVELVQIWKETYNKEYQENGIFEEQIQVYNINTLNPRLENLKPMNLSEIQRKRHEWASILRANAVGDRVLALNKLMNLFLCKITDELDNKENLQFRWNGNTQDTAFNLVDRLQKLYQTGMKKYLNQDITYYSKDDIEENLKVYKDTTAQTKIQNIFNELKYFSNSDFSFIEVYNETLFRKNFQILLPIVQSLQNISFTKGADSNILGDYFESYIHDMPQQEGQYFTPVPLVNFIVASLPVLKNAKVLDFSCGAGHFLTQYAELNKNYQKAYFLGVDKDQRLAKIAKIASFMHGENMNIYAYDSLKKAQIDDEKHQKALNDNSFNVLISNPPYSVDGFLDTLDEDSRRDYEIFSENLNINTNNAIECFFIEKAAKVLQNKGLLALVLPNSLLSKDGIYQNTRELLLREFHIICICELGSATFFKTGTSPIIIFALRKDRETPTITSQSAIYKNFYELILENKFENICRSYDNFLPLLHSYCIFQSYDEEEFKALLKLEIKTNSNLFKNEIFKEYTNAYNEFVAKEKKIHNDKTEKMKDKQKRGKFKEQNLFKPSMSKESFIREKECEKFLYFCYCHQSNPLIIKAPKDLKEQKKFLGYEWSNTKGKQGIVYINATSISDIKTTLYNPKEKYDRTKLSFYILQEYLKRLGNEFLAENSSSHTELNKMSYKASSTDTNSLNEDSHADELIPENLQPYIFRARLVDMLDFSTSNFNKAINLNPSLRGSEATQQNPFANTKFELIKLGEIITESPKSKVKVSEAKENKSGAYPFYTSGLNIYRYDEALTQGENIYLSTGGNAIVQFYNGESAYSTDTYVIKSKDKRALTKFIFYVLEAQTRYINDFLFKGIGLKHLQKPEFKNLKIPLPPLEIQKQIVSECEEVEFQAHSIEALITQYQNLIKAILVKCGICESVPSQENTINEIIHAIHHFKFNTSPQISNEILTAMDLNALLETLPTPPPNGWGRRKLGGIADIIAGQSPESKFYNSDKEGLLFFQGKKDFGKKYLKDSQIYTSQITKESVRNDILMSVRAPVGDANLNPYEKICIGRGLTAIRSENYKFLFLCIQHNKHLFVGNQGMVFESISTSALKDTKIPLPPLDSQNKIVAVIENIESKITHLQELNKHLSTQKGEILQKFLNA